MKFYKSFLLMCTVFAAPALGQSGILEEAMPKVKEIFAGTTFVADDGTVKAFGDFYRHNDGYGIDVDINRPDGSEMTASSFIYERKGRLFVDEGGECYNLTFRTASGNYFVTPCDPASTDFISHECRLRDGRSVCRQKFREEDGGLRIVTLREAE